MAKLRIQVFILAACLIGVIMAKRYVNKLAEQAGVSDHAEPGSPVSANAAEPGVVQVP